MHEMEDSAFQSAVVEKTYFGVNVWDKLDFASGRQVENSIGTISGYGSVRVCAPCAPGVERSAAS